MLPSRSQSAPPLDFTHRLHFCGFHQHLALYIQPPAVRGEIGSDSPSLSTGTFPPLPTPCLFLCQPFPMATQPTLKPASPHSTFFNTLTIWLTSCLNPHRTQESIRTSSDPSGVALLTVPRDVTSHLCSSRGLATATEGNAAL